MELDFNCTQLDTFKVDLVIGIPEDSLLVNELGSDVLPVKGDTILISCLGPTPTPPKQPSPGDTHGDGCSDQQENGFVPDQGGQRTYQSFWDYGDMPDPNADPERDRKIRIGDIVRVVLRFGTDDNNGAAPINRNTDPLSTPPKTGYHPAYDRGGQVGINPWDQAPPNGTIRVPDIVAIVQQFGHDCA